jgi:hypothetical protein
MPVGGLSRRAFIKVGVNTGGGAVLGLFLSSANRYAQAASPQNQGGAMPSQTTSAQKTNLFLIDDLEDTSRTRALAKGDLDALRAVGDWIKTFVAKPHKDLGRAGPVCPFVPVGLERKTTWLAPEQVANRSVPDVVQLISGYKRLFLDAQPIDGEGLDYKSIVVVFTDLPADRAKNLFDGVLKDLAVPSYVDDGLVLGAFHKSNEGTAIYNSNFRPFTAPVPFLLMRHAVISDWKFFLDDQDWLNRWAHRYGESGVQALAAELRTLPWRARSLTQESR